MHARTARVVDRRQGGQLRRIARMHASSKTWSGTRQTRPFVACQANATVVQQSTTGRVCTRANPASIRCVVASQRGNRISEWQHEVCVPMRHFDHHSIDVSLLRGDTALPRST